MAFDFNGGYNRNNFINFLRTDLFRNKFVQQQIPVKPERKTAFFVENGIFQLGTIQLGEEEISVFEIKQSSKNDPRVTLTQDTFKLMGDLGIDNAIVALYVDDKSSWRFSLLTTKYEDFKKTTSNPKRFSFILGPNEKIRTVNQQLIKKGEIKDFEDLVSRFDVEVVRQEFFETYLELFVRLYKEILKDKPFADLLSSQNVDLVSFTKNLLGKTIFLYFVQQKGWLGLGKNTTTKYGEGNKNFMRKLWLNFKEQGESLCTHEKTGYFYNDYLEWLFFAGLNVDRRKNDDRFEQLQMKVPYLNGGLFREEYEGWKTNISRISNDIFSNKDEDGILDIFDRYNFTIDEDSLYDTDIAVDPEMLGRIFEKMISISSKNIDDVLKLYDNKKKNAKFDFGKDLNKELGAFYTPREIVHYMARESLVSYLHNKTGISIDNINIIFDLKEKFLLNSTDMKKAEYSTEKLIEIGNSIVDIDEALKNVKILDPAVGSGAFPMGLLLEISSLRYYIYKVFNKILKDKLEKYLDKRNDVSLYKIKREIILNNIHGIDIDPGAIDIAKLRFRLSLVVDEQEPEPLPNFEFKFISANSLIPLEEGSLFTKADVIEKLKNLRDEYYKCDDKDEKEKLKNKFYDIKRELTGFGKSRLDFKSKKERDEYLIQSYNANSDLRNRQILEWDPFETKEYTKRSDTELMMGQDKFNIVIGNPPYIKEYENRDAFNGFREHSPYYMGKMDIRYGFACHGLDLLEEKGTLCFIAQNNRTTSAGAKIMRNKIMKDSIIKYMIDFNTYLVFENAKIQTMIMMFEKNNISDEYAFDYRMLLQGATKKDMLQLLEGGSTTKTKYMNPVIKRELYDNKIFTFSTHDSLLSKISDNKEYLLDNELGQGIVPALDDYFIIYDLSKFSDKERHYIKPFFTGIKDKYLAYPTEKYLIYMSAKNFSGSDLEGFPNLKQHFEPHKQELIASKIQYKTPNKPYFFVHRERDEKFFLEGNEKIVAQVRCEYPKFYYTKESFYGSRALFFINTDRWNMKFLLGILNSKLVYFWLKNKGKVQGNVLKLDKEPIQNIPLPKEDGRDSKIVDLVNEIIEKKSNDLDTSDLEKQIDQLVYKLYGLTDEEIQLVEDSFK